MTTDRGTPGWNAEICDCESCADPAPPSPSPSPPEDAECYCVSPTCSLTHPEPGPEDDFDQWAIPAPTPDGEREDWCDHCGTIGPGILLARSCPVHGDRARLIALVEKVQRTHGGGRFAPALADELLAAGFRREAEGCTCGWGETHDPDNPRCDLQLAEKRR